MLLYVHPSNLLFGSLPWPFPLPPRAFTSAPTITLATTGSGYCIMLSGVGSLACQGMTIF
jgi:hypothetical protein